jgi:hypothetical protein
MDGARDQGVMYGGGAMDQGSTGRTLMAAALRQQRRVRDAVSRGQRTMEAAVEHLRVEAAAAATSAAALGRQRRELAQRAWRQLLRDTRTAGE